MVSLRRPYCDVVRMIAGIAHAGMSATYPLDMVRGRLTVQSIQGSHRYRGIMHATSVIIKEASPCPTQAEKLPQYAYSIPASALAFVWHLHSTVEVPTGSKCRSRHNPRQPDSITV